jgi:hypothetical protein
MADFSQAALEDVDQLNTAVFGVRLDPDAVSLIDSVLDDCRALAASSPELAAKIDDARLALNDEDEEEDDDEDDDDEDESAADSPS